MPAWAGDESGPLNYLQEFQSREQAIEQAFNNVGVGTSNSTGGLPRLPS